MCEGTLTPIASCEYLPKKRERKKKEGRASYIKTCVLCNSLVNQLEKTGFLGEFLFRIKIHTKLKLF